MENKETTYNLPDSWIWTTLGEIGIVTSGGTPSSRQPDFWGGDIAWITPADLSNYKNKYIEQGQRSITKVGLDNSSAKLLPKGTVLFSSRAPIGYTVIAKNEIATNQGFKNLILTKSGYPDYIYYFLLASKQLAESYASGTTFLELSATKFSQIPIPLPPLSEQYRIVEKIEELFSELDKAQENLLNARKQLEIYKQVVLNVAFNSSDFNTIKISQTGQIETGNTPSKRKSENYANEYNFYKPSDVHSNVYLINSIDKLSKIGYENSTIAPINSILVTCIGTIGNAAIVGVEGAFNQQINAIIPDKIYNPKFLYYQVLSLDFQKNLREKVSATTLPIINKSKFSALDVKTCPIDCQNKIVQFIEYRFTLIDNIANSVADNLKRIEVFKHIILKKAFSGDLVPQDINDELANELLKRIKEEIRLSQIQQKEITKSKPKKLVLMKSNKTVKEILEEATEPIEAREIWQKSKHKDDIEKFYEELKQLSTNVEEIREGKISKLFLKK